MSIEQTIGIDVSQGHLDICVPGFRVVRVGNDEASLRSWSAGAALQRVTLEASGGYERTAVRVLRDLGFTVDVLNPRKVRRLADALGYGAKTDRLDAELLSKVGGILAARCQTSSEQTALRDKTRRVLQLANSLGSVRKRLLVPELDACVKRSLRREECFLKGELKCIREEIQSEMSEPQKARLKLVTSVPGVGVETSRTVLAELPEDLSTFTDAELCSYAGLAPMDASSGMWTGRKRIRKGNCYLKRNLYCAVLATLRVSPEFRARYDRMRAQGKAHQQAAVALMRRLLIRIVTVLRRQTPWKNVSST